MKSSKKAKILSYVFLGVAVLSFIGAIVIAVMNGTNHIDWVLMWLISSGLWGFCGIMSFKGAKIIKEKEDSKPKINAFNYGKKKTLHKKGKR